MASKFPALLESLSVKYGYVLMEHTPRGMTKPVYQILDKRSGVVLAQVEPISSRYNIHKGMKWSVSDFVKYHNFKTMGDVVAFLDEKFAKQRGGKLSKTDSVVEPKGIGAMTLTQYINQKNPKRFVSVNLKKSEVRTLPWVSYGGEQIREVYVNKFPQSTYVQIWGDPVLYTSDSQGNPQKMSVFRLADWDDNLKGIGRAKSGSLTKLSKLKKGDGFSKVGKDGREMDRLYIYGGKERRYNRWGDFLGWEFTFSAYDDISYFGRSVKDIDVVKL